MSKKDDNTSKKIYSSNIIKFFIITIISIVLLLIGSKLEDIEKVFNEKTIEIVDVGELPKEFSLSNDSNLQIIFFNVGQGDCILISDNVENMLIDSGNNEDGKYLVEYLKQE